jgi:catechol 2,3-dioxygenase-like lactoylglutathione lyase family enzyme
LAILFAASQPMAQTTAHAEERRMTDLQFRASNFFVPDVPATVRFYEEAFGLKLRYMHPNSGYAELETGPTLLAFVSERFIKDAKLLGGTETLPNRPDSSPIAAQVAFLTKQINADWQRAVQAGATIVKEPEAKPWGQTAGYLRDINGIIVELCTPRPSD